MTDSHDASRSLGLRTTDEVARAVAAAAAVALVPVGSLEPHGPHLPLGLDTMLGEEAARRACAALAERGVEAWIAPSVAYGVTDCADGFAGAVGVSAEAVTSTLRALATRLLASGFRHVCFVSNHLEPAHDAAVRAAASGLPTGRASVASPLTKRWARTLSDEFKRGACHAGRYETSMALAAGVRVRGVYRELPSLDVALPRELAAGRSRFSDMGLARAYTGAPSEATAEEGESLFERHVAMIVAEVTEALAVAEAAAGRPGTPPGDPPTHGDARVRGGAPGNQVEHAAADPPASRAARAEVDPPAARAAPSPERGAFDARAARGARAPSPVRSARTYASKDDMDARLLATLTRMIEGQAYRELAAARLFGFGLQFVPELKWLKFMTWHIREETEHYEAVARMYRELTGESVEPRVVERLAQRPPFEYARSWFELAMAQFLYDRGGYWQLLEYEECAFLPYRAVVAKIVKEEAGHQRLGERIVRELCKTGRYDDVKQPIFDTWFRQGMLSFGRPGTEANRYAIEHGLKKRDPGEVMQDFIDDIKPAVKACGLRFPEPGRIGLEVPPDLEWSLDGVADVSVAGAS